ncbi:putative Ctr copper transporter [Rosa chinensis]|uniref:Copper transport protein n=1 Tax=Rosa chinensis TaxID=74649 RepID=A0A2P6QJD0_ROSCH|nr:putative Ctr copper transporter [Rosa chinensis]
MKTHFTFFRGKNTTAIIFPGWPGESLESYILALIAVFLLSLVVEWLSHARLIEPSSDNNIADGLRQTLMYGSRVGLSYLVMLAVMSFDVGVLLAAIAGCSVGFLVFGSRVFMRSKVGHSNMDQTDLPPLKC